MDHRRPLLACERQTDGASIIQHSLRSSPQRSGFSSRISPSAHYTINASSRRLFAGQGIDAR